LRNVLKAQAGRESERFHQKTSTLFFDIEKHAFQVELVVFRRRKV